MGKIIDLIKAICTRTQEIESYLNKTKLIKLLYLIDVEYYRKYKKTFTNFKWICYDYGPWAYEYNDVYDLIMSSPDFKVVEKKPPKNISFITCVEDQKEFSDIFKKLEDSMLFRELINKWATEGLNEILNYVYFYTEPMIDTKRKEKLDFSKINKFETIPKFKLEKGKLSTKEIRTIRATLKEKLVRRKEKDLEEVMQPKYDELYWQEMEKLDYDNEY